jgi:hypothetical protein
MEHNSNLSNQVAFMDVGNIHYDIAGVKSDNWLILGDIT